MILPITENRGFWGGGSQNCLNYDLFDFYDCCDLGYTCFRVFNHLNHINHKNHSSDNWLFGLGIEVKTGLRL